MKFREGNKDDLNALKQLGIKSWSVFEKELSKKNWKKLLDSLNDNKTYEQLFKNACCLACENKEGNIIGMVFLVFFRKSN